VQGKGFEGKHSLDYLEEKNSWEWIVLTSKKVKEFAKKAGADLVGIGSMDRFGII